jgi:hypothetical protein
LPYLVWGETWILILRDEHGLRVFENRMLKGIFRPEKGWEPGENYMTRTFILSTPCQIFLE